MKNIGSHIEENVCNEMCFDHFQYFIFNVKIY